MREIIVAGVFAIAMTATAAVPAEAGGLNCWYEEFYSDDIDVDGDNVVDPGSGQFLGYIAHCEVESEEVQP